MTALLKAARRPLLISVLVAAAVIGAACSSEDETADADATPATLAEEIAVENVRARATPGLEDENSAAYAVITNRGAVADRLIGASVDAAVAGRAELHTTIREGDMMRMQQVEGWDIEPGASLELMPGGNHVMLIGIARQFVVGDVFTLTLVFEHAGEVQVEVPVMEIATTPMSGAATATPTVMP
ncbi:MAG: copper chaperone PCu(A)C [Dehalococcoidia bacterium]